MKTNNAVWLNIICAQNAAQMKAKLFAIGFRRVKKKIYAKESGEQVSKEEKLI